MPPHGHHGHHGHHRGGGNYGIGPWWGPGYGQAWDPSLDSKLVVIDNEGDRDKDRRIMAHIMTLPKAQRAAAYTNFFGKPPAEGALGSFGEDMALFLTSPPGLTVIVIAAYLVFRKKKR